MLSVLSIILTIVIIAVSILIVLIVLLQRPKQEGLGAAFGGSTLDSALGAHTTDVLQKITTWFGIIFFVSAIGLTMVKTRQFNHEGGANVLDAAIEKEKAVPAIPTIPPISGIPGGTDPAIPAATEGQPAAVIPPITPKEDAAAETPPASTPAAPAESDKPDAAPAATPEADDPAASDKPDAK